MIHACWRPRFVAGKVSLKIRWLCFQPATQTLEASDAIVFVRLKLPALFNVDRNGAIGNQYIIIV